MITRKIDDFGRFVLPKEMRDALKVKNGDSLEILMEGNCIIISKPEESCVFCGSLDNTRKYQNQHICRWCEQDIFEHALSVSKQ